MSKQWQDEFLDKGKEIMGVDCSGLIGVVSKLLLDEKNRTRSELTDEITERNSHVTKWITGLKIIKSPAVHRGNIMVNAEEFDRKLTKQS